MFIRPNRFDDCYGEAVALAYAITAILSGTITEMCSRKMNEKPTKSVEDKNRF